MESGKRYLEYDRDKLVQIALETLEALELNRDFQGELYAHYTRDLRDVLGLTLTQPLQNAYRQIEEARCQPRARAS